MMLRYVLVEPPIAHLRSINGCEANIHVERTEYDLTFVCIYEHETDALVIIKVGHSLGYAPKVADGQVTVAHAVLAFALVARRAKVYVGQKTPHIRVL